MADRTLRLFLATLGISWLLAASASAEVYRIEDQADFDAFRTGNMTGLEVSTLGEISSGYRGDEQDKTVVMLDGDDTVLFKRGEYFRGPLRLSRSDEGRAINLTAFGPGVPPVIDGAPMGGSVSTTPHPRGAQYGVGLYATLAIHDSGGWHVRGLDIRNADTQNKAIQPYETRHLRAGLAFIANDSGRHRDILVEGNSFSHIYGEPTSKENGAIMLLVDCRRGEGGPGRCHPDTEKATASAFDDAIITSNTMRGIDGVGIRIKSVWSIGDENGDGQVTGPELREAAAGSSTHELYRVASTGLRIIGNRVSDTGKNAMTIGESNGPVISHNRVGPNIGWAYTGNSIFTFSTDDAIIEHNELWGNTSLDPGEQDRCAIDADFSARNTIIQYNYTHDNNCAYAVMKRDNQGIIIRHNVSENELFGIFYMGFPTAFRSQDIDVYNNTFVSDAPGMQVFLRRPDPDDGTFKSRWPINMDFRDNLIAFNADSSWGWPLFVEPSSDLAQENPRILEAGNRASGNVAVGWEAWGPGIEHMSWREAKLIAGAGGLTPCQFSPLITDLDTDTTVRDFFGNLPLEQGARVGALYGPSSEC